MKIHRNFEVWIVLAILLLAAFLRFYQLDQYMTFLGDEGRDALMVKRILVDHDFPLLGPPTSVGNIYLGPFYYYMMAVPMAIFWLNPVAAAGMVALIGVATVALIYFLARNWFDTWPAVLASLLYSLSFVTVTYSHSSWNPNPAPFFALSAIVGIYFARKSHNFLWLLLSGFSLSAAVQMHYLALILLPIFLTFWIFELILQITKITYRHFILGTISAILLFLFLLSPLVIFDLKYNFLNFHAISAFFSSRETTVNLNILNSLGRVAPLYQSKLIGRYLAGDNQILAIVISLAVLCPLILSLLKIKAKQNVLETINQNWSYFALGIWLIIGLLGLSLYKQSIFDHYLGFINPAPFLLLAALAAFFKKYWQKLFVIVLVVILGFVNLQKDPLLFPPNQQLQKTQEIAKFVIDYSNHQPFNFALIAKNNYDAAYQYYLDLYGFKPKPLAVEVTDQLFVVCEDQVCQPVGHPKYEIAAFGWTKIESEKDLYGVKVFKLIHNPEQK